MRSLSARLPALVASALLLAAPAARADTVDASARSTARKLGQEAAKLYEAGSYAAALEKFNTADSLVPAPTLGLYAARCLARLGLLVEASERYLEVTRMQLDRAALPVMRKAQVDAVSERDKLLPTIPMLDVRLEGPQGDGVLVTVDDKPLLPGLLGEKRPIDPGKHVAVAKRADTSVRQEVMLAPGGTAQIVLLMPALPAAPVATTPPLRVAGWVGVGVGAAGAVLAAVSGAITIAVGQSLLGECTAGNKMCPTTASGRIATYHLTGKLTTVGLITGVVGLGFGIPAVVLSPKAAYVSPDGSPAPAPKAMIAPWITWGGAGVRGTF
jgi:hypothetical protein